MKHSITGQTSSLGSMPIEVLSRIALHTVSTSSGIPTARELTAVRALLLTGRVVHQKLSPMHNPHLYASIFHLMFDIEAVKRRMGPRAVVSSVLASELQQRIEALKRINAGLNAAKIEEGDSDVTSTDLARMFLMMSENDGKNKHQLAAMVNLSYVPDLLFAHASRIRPSPRRGILNSALALIIAIMWISDSSHALRNEDPARRAAILDLLQPLVVSTNSHSDILNLLSGALQDCGSVANITYFGMTCRFSLASLIPFARLCTAARYNAVKEIHRIGSGERCIPGTSNSSTQFDDDWSRYITINTPIAVGSLRYYPYKPCVFEGLWEGAWFIPCPINPTHDIIMCTQPLRCHLREYVSIRSEDSVAFVDGRDGGKEDTLARAWLPEGVAFDETAESLRIYDPTKSRWLCYKPRSRLVFGDIHELPAVLDTILVGDTETSRGAAPGVYVFHGRVRREDGSVALVRKPVDPLHDELGTWVFHGQVHGRKELVGNWRVTSTADYTAAGKGWFHLLKVGNDLILE